MTKKISEKNDSALMSSIESDIIDNKQTGEVNGGQETAGFGPMSYMLKREFKKLPHKNVPLNSKKLVAICASTGGPNALAKIIPKLPKDLNAPVIMVQHMPSGFTDSMAKRLDEKSEITVTEAENGFKLRKGHMYIAKGGKHLSITGRRSGLYISLLDTPPRSGLRPCADIMFESLMKLDLDEIICVVLTGMGSDGTRGIGELCEKKNVYVIAQDEKTSAVDGMPGMVRKAGLADEVLPLEEIADAITRVTGIKLSTDGNGGN